MHYRKHSIAVLFLFLCLPLAALAGTTVPPSYDQQDNDQATYTFAMTGTVKATMPDGSVIKETGGLKFTTLARFLGVTSDNVLRIETEVTSGTRSVTVKGKSKSEALEPFSANYELTPQGVITYRDASNPPMVMSSEIMVSAMPDDAMLVHGAGVLPKKAPQKAGETWKGTVALPSFSGASGLETPLKFASKYLGQVKFANRNCWKIKTTYRMYAEETENIPEYGGEILLKQTLSGASTWLFDPAAGVVVKGDGTATMKATVIGTAADGEQITFHVLVTLSDQEKLTEFNGEKVPTK